MPRTRAGIPRRYIRTELDETHHMGIEISHMMITIDLQVLDDTRRHIITLRYSARTNKYDEGNDAQLTLINPNNSHDTIPVGAVGDDYNTDLNTLIAGTMMSRMFRRIHNFHKVSDQSFQFPISGYRFINFEGTINYVDLPRLIKNTFSMRDYWDV
jgi:hypothetical protein